MALPITSIPILTGDAALRFETEAEANYQKYLNRTPEEEKAVKARYDKGLARVRKMLEKAHLD